MFIRIVTAETFPYTPVDEESGVRYESSFTLKTITDEIEKDLLKKHTRPHWEKKSRRMVDKLDQPAYVAEVIDTAIVGWSNVKDEHGNDLPCTSEYKALLPEKWKAEIMRLTAGKEGAEVIAQADEEKKRSKGSSPSKLTAVGT